MDMKVEIEMDGDMSVDMNMNMDVDMNVDGDRGDMGMVGMDQWWIWDNDGDMERDMDRGYGTMMTRGTMMDMGDMDRDGG
jgi:hypothetical protein